MRRLCGAAPTGGGLSLPILSTGRVVSPRGEKVQTAAHLVTRAAEHGRPMIFAQMGMIQAVHFKSGAR
jgi:hypothetical protein